VIDFGGTRDKHGLIVGYHDFIRKKDVICCESLLDVNTGTDVIKSTSIGLEKIMQKDHINIVTHQRFIDAPGQIQVDLNKERFHITGVTKGEGSFDAGINAMRMGFVNETLEIWPECEMLIKCLKYGKLNTNRTDFERHPVFGHLDILAALMYFLRHLNRNDPFPQHYGLSAKTHHIDKNKPLSKESANLRRGLFG
jgi:hypothetical protein